MQRARSAGIMKSKLAGEVVVWSPPIYASAKSIAAFYVSSPPEWRILSVAADTCSCFLLIVHGGGYGGDA